MERPRTSVILAMSADGKIGDAQRHHPQFGSKADYAHLEERVAEADGILFGAGTLRAGGSAMRVQRQTLIDQRVHQGKPPQPVQIVCSRTGEIDPDIMFFRQGVPRWLVTLPAGAEAWKDSSHFDQIVTSKTPEGEVDWTTVFEHCHQAGMETIAVLGGGDLIAALVEADYIDELWLTLCPLLVGGKTAPTPVDGPGLTETLAPRLKLLSCEQVEDELFLHYQVIHPA